MATGLAGNDWFAGVQSQNNSRQAMCLAFIKNMDF